MLLKKAFRDSNCAFSHYYQHFWLNSEYSIRVFHYVFYHQSLFGYALCHVWLIGLCKSYHALLQRLSQLPFPQSILCMDISHMCLF